MEIAKWKKGVLETITLGEILPLFLSLLMVLFTPPTKMS
jgi:hypothetical protein